MPFDLAPEIRKKIEQHFISLLGERVFNESQKESEIKFSKDSGNIIDDYETLSAMEFKVPENAPSIRTPLNIYAMTIEQIESQAKKDVKNLIDILEVFCALVQKAQMERQGSTIDITDVYKKWLAEFANRDTTTYECFVELLTQINKASYVLIKSKQLNSNSQCLHTALMIAHLNFKFCYVYLGFAWEKQNIARIFTSRLHDALETWLSHINNGGLSLTDAAHLKMLTQLTSYKDISKRIMESLHLKLGEANNKKNIENPIQWIDATVQQEFQVKIDETGQPLAKKQKIQKKNNFKVLTLDQAEKIKEKLLIGFNAHIELLCGRKDDDYFVTWERTLNRFDSIIWSMYHLEELKIEHTDDYSERDLGELVNEYLENESNEKAKGDIKADLAEAVEDNVKYIDRFLKAERWFNEKYATHPTLELYDKFIELQQCEIKNISDWFGKLTTEIKKLTAIYNEGKFQLENVPILDEINLHNFRLMTGNILLRLNYIFGRVDEEHVLFFIRSARDFFENLEKFKKYWEPSKFDPSESIDKLYCHVESCHEVIQIINPDKKKSYGGMVDINLYYDQYLEPERDFLISKQLEIALNHAKSLLASSVDFNITKVTSALIELSKIKMDGLDENAKWHCYSTIYDLFERSLSYKVPYRQLNLYFNFGINILQELIKYELSRQNLPYNASAHQLESEKIEFNAQEKRIIKYFSGVKCIFEVINEPKWRAQIFFAKGAITEINSVINKTNESFELLKKLLIKWKSRIDQPDFCLVTFSQQKVPVIEKISGEFFRFSKSIEKSLFVTQGQLLSNENISDAKLENLCLTLGSLLVPQPQAHLNMLHESYSFGINSLQLEETANLSMAKMIMECVRIIDSKNRNTDENLAPLILTYLSTFNELMEYIRNDHIKKSKYCRKNKPEIIKNYQKSFQALLDHKGDFKNNLDIELMQNILFQILKGTFIFLKNKMQNQNLKVVDLNECKQNFSFILSLLKMMTGFDIYKYNQEAMNLFLDAGIQTYSLAKQYLELLYASNTPSFYCSDEVRIVFAFLNDMKFVLKNAGELAVQLQYLTSEQTQSQYAAINTLPDNSLIQALMDYERLTKLNLFDIADNLETFRHKKLGVLVLQYCLYRLQGLEIYKDALKTFNDALLFEKLNTKIFDYLKQIFTYDGQMKLQQYQVQSFDSQEIFHNIITINKLLLESMNKNNIEHLANENNIVNLIDIEAYIINNFYKLIKSSYDNKNQLWPFEMAKKIASAMTAFFESPRAAAMTDSTAITDNYQKVMRSLTDLEKKLSFRPLDIDAEKLSDFFETKNVDRDNLKKIVHTFLKVFESRFNDHSQIKREVSQELNAQTFNLNQKFFTTHAIHNFKGKLVDDRLMENLTTAANESIDWNYYKASIESDTKKMLITHVRELLMIFEDYHSIFMSNIVLESKVLSCDENNHVSLKPLFLYLVNISESLADGNFAQIHPDIGLSLSIKMGHFTISKIFTYYGYLNQDKEIKNILLQSMLNFSEMLNKNVTKITQIGDVHFFEKYIFEMEKFFQYFYKGSLENLNLDLKNKFYTSFNSFMYKILMYYYSQLIIKLNEDVIYHLPLITFMHNFFDLGDKPFELNFAELSLTIMDLFSKKIQVCPSESLIPKEFMQKFIACLEKFKINSDLNQYNFAEKITGIEKILTNRDRTKKPGNFGHAYLTFEFSSWVDPEETKPIEEIQNGANMHL